MNLDIALKLLNRCWVVLFYQLAQFMITVYTLKQSNYNLHMTKVDKILNKKVLQKNGLKT